MTPRLFVYGSLAPGRTNEHVLAHVEGTWEPATVRGNLVEKGWGTGLGFPALAPAEDAPEVSGLVLTSPDLDGYWARLDEFEGAEYQRVVVTATLADGHAVSAYVYVHRAPD